MADRTSLYEWQKVMLTGSLESIREPCFCINKNFRIQKPGSRRGRCSRFLVEAINQWCYEGRSGKSIHVVVHGDKEQGL